MQFSRIELPYEFDALEPYIDSETMETHYTKHHAGYESKLNSALEGVDHDFESIEDVLKNIKELPDDVMQAVINNGGGLANHNLFFSTLSPEGGGEPVGDLLEEIEDVFGSFDDFTAEFETAALGQFGSGWAWLVVNQDDELEIYSTPNQDSPLMNGHKPILGIDVWEHAYYLHYQNKRAEYVSNFWNVVDWEKVAELRN